VLSDSDREKVRLQDGRLYFRAQEHLHLAEGHPERLVFDFARLATAPDRAFLEFARIWGVLGICPHGDHIHHRMPVCLPRLVGDEMAEPISRWRKRARVVQALLNIKTALDRKQSGQSADWRVIWRGLPPNSRSDAADKLALAGSIFLSTVNLQPVLQQIRGRLTVTFVGGNIVTLLKNHGPKPQDSPVAVHLGYFAR
jgi:hypothetical protein